MMDEHYLMKQVKAIRNACAHNSCIINGFKPGLQSSVNTSLVVTAALSKGGVRNSKSRRAKLDNPVVQQMVVTLYTCWTIVRSEDANRRAVAALQRLRARFFEHRWYYSKNDALMSFFVFIDRIIDSWFPMPQDNGTQKKP
jgi:hypothetical protein